MNPLTCFKLPTTDHMAHLVLSRPQALNTMNPTFWRELDQVLTHINKAADPLSGSGPGRGGDRIPGQIQGQTSTRHGAYLWTSDFGIHDFKALLAAPRSAGPGGSGLALV